MEGGDRDGGDAPGQSAHVVKHGRVAVYLGDLKGEGTGEVGITDCSGERRKFEFPEKPGGSLIIIKSYYGTKVGMIAVSDGEAGLGCECKIE